MQPEDLTQSLLSSAERPLMPSWDWSAAFKVAWKHKIWQDCSGIEAALRSQVRTASGSHKVCRVLRSSRVSSLPFSPTSRALKGRRVGASKGGPGICRQVCLTAVTFQSHQNKFFFSFVYPCSCSLCSPCKVCLHLPPSSFCIRNSQIPQPRVRKCNAHPAGCPEPALTLPLPLGNSSLPHTFPPPDLYWHWPLLLK